MLKVIKAEWDIHNVESDIMSNRNNIEWDKMLNRNNVEWDKRRMTKCRMGQNVEE
jgi:hypothetical protein